MSPTLRAAGRPLALGTEAMSGSMQVSCAKHQMGPSGAPAVPPPRLLSHPQPLWSLASMEASLTPLYPQGLVHDPNSPLHPDLASASVWAQPQRISSLATSTSKGSGLLMLPAPLPASLPLSPPRLFSCSCQATGQEGAQLPSPSEGDLEGNEAQSCFSL